MERGEVPEARCGRLLLRHDLPCPMSGPGGMPVSRPAHTHLIRHVVPRLAALRLLAKACYYSSPRLASHENPQPN
jgi:hypothetical protein